MQGPALSKDASGDDISAGTSISSVVNAPPKEPEFFEACSASAQDILFPLKRYKWPDDFGMLQQFRSFRSTPDGDIHDRMQQRKSGRDHHDHALLTRQFFPMIDARPPQTATAIVAHPASINDSRFYPTPQWTSLPFCHHDAFSVPQAVQPSKKSRRGPRSKSSQYRGVTFYRRTGRWESHIW